MSSILDVDVVVVTAAVSRPIHTRHSVPGILITRGSRVYLDAGLLREPRWSQDLGCPRYPWVLGVPGTHQNQDLSMREVWKRICLDVTPARQPSKLRLKFKTNRPRFQLRLRRVAKHPIRFPLNFGRLRVFSFMSIRSLLDFPAGSRSIETEKKRTTTIGM